MQLTGLAAAALGAERERGDVDMCSAWAPVYAIDILRMAFP